MCARAGTSSTPHQPQRAGLQHFAAAANDRVDALLTALAGSAARFDKKLERRRRQKDRSHKFDHKLAHRSITVEFGSYTELFVRKHNTRTITHALENFLLTGKCDLLHGHAVGNVRFEAEDAREPRTDVDRIDVARKRAVSATSISVKSQLKDFSLFLIATRCERGRGN